MNSYSVALSSNEKISLASNLSTMLSAGIPILETVDSLLEDSKGAQRKVLETLKNDLIQGRSVHMSFSQFPKVFDKVTINLIKAAETAGTLDTTLKDLSITIRKENEFSDKIRSALLYPVLIVGLFIAVLLMILTVVVPKISGVFARLRVELPLPTKILIYLSNLLLHQTWFFIAGVLLIILFFIYLFKVKKKSLFEMLFFIPFMGGLAKEIDLTRFSRSLYLLLNSGIPIPNALELSQDVVVKKEVLQMIEYSKEIVVSGRKLSEGLKAYKHVFPPIAIKIVEAGERTGSLEKSMQEVSDYLDYQVSNTLKTVTALLEPLMLIGVGVLIGGMMLAIIAPIYGIIGQVTPR